MPTKPRSPVITDPMPEPVEPPIVPEPLGPDADAARAAFYQPAIEQEEAERAAEQAEARRQQDRLAAWARALARRLPPLIAALEMKPVPPFSVPERERHVGLDLIRALDNLFQAREGLIMFKDKAASWLPRLLSTLDGPLLAPGELQAQERNVQSLHDGFVGLDAQVATLRRHHRELAEVAAKSGAVVEAYRVWAEETGAS